MMVPSFLFVVFSLVYIRVSAESTFIESESTQCGNVFTEKQFILTSDYYPYSYSPNKECFYLLQGVNCTKKFVIKFLDFDIKGSVGCTNDRLEIGHQDALCGAINGSKEYKAEEGSLKLKFISDNELEKRNRGFRVLVTRIDSCDLDNSSRESNITFVNQNTSEVTTDITQVDWTSKRTLIGPTYIPPTTNQCCQNNIFSSKRFFLVSPNFPYSGKTRTDCIYVIKKASSQVCRLRIHILFFSVGPPIETSCPYGHLEIDGKYICGCNSDLKLTTDFRALDSKVLKYYSPGYNGNEYYGFVLQVIQDECPKRYSPEEGILAERSKGNFSFYNDLYNRVSWPKNSNIDQLKLVNERIQRFPPEYNRLETKQIGNIFKHFYFFAPEEEKDITWTEGRQEREETNYIEISTINTLLTNLHNYQECIQWNNNQMILLNRRFGSSLYQMCKSFQQSNIDVRNCLILNNPRGNIRSPGYPLAYSANRKICYRFPILPGYCAVNLLFKDFQIERSYDCLKDYLAINQDRYCGNYLQNKQVTINTQGKSHQDINFITDANYCGKGFFATYQQIPCQNMDYPNTSNNCPPESPSVNCNKIIREKYFVISNEAQNTFCSYNIRKVSEDVCMVELYFERFNLPCDSESLTIDGKVYCGDMTGQTLTIDIQEETTLLYKRNSIYRTQDYSGNFLIQGTQLSDDCEAIIPDAVRLTQRNSKALPSISTKKWEKKMNPYYQADICGLIQNNVTLEELPHKVCEMLIRKHNILDCDFSKAEFTDLSNHEKNLKKIRLTSGEAEQLDYKIIECQN